MSKYSKLERRFEAERAAEKFLRMLRIVERSKWRSITTRDIFVQERNYEYLEKWRMTRSEKPKWLSRKLDPEHRAKAKRMFAGEVSLEALSKCVVDGYNVSLKWDAYSEAFLASMFPPLGSDNSGYILTARGGTPQDALSYLLYKHFEVFDGSWSLEDTEG